MSDASRPLVAAAWMIGAVFSFTAMTVAGRELASELNTFELMFYRSGIGFGIVLVMIALSRRGFAQVRSGRMGLHMGRNLVHFSAQNLWFYAIATIPLAQLTALEFTNPIWVALLAPLVLGERWTLVRLLAALLGFAGILLIARPGSGALEIGHAAALASALGFALTALFTKFIMRNDTVLCVLFWMTATQTVFGALTALPGGLPTLSLSLWPWMVVVSITGLSAHYCLSSALACAPATIVSPMEFARLPVVAVVAMLLYDEPLEWIVFIGGAMILAANLTNIVTERRAARRRQVAPPAPLSRPPETC